MAELPEKLREIFFPRENYPAALQWKPLLLLEAHADSSRRAVPLSHAAFEMRSRVVDSGVSKLVRFHPARVYEFYFPAKILQRHRDARVSPLRKLYFSCFRDLSA